MRFFVVFSAFSAVSAVKTLTLRKLRVNANLDSHWDGRRATPRQKQ